MSKDNIGNREKLSGALNSVGREIFEDLTLDKQLRQEGFEQVAEATREDLGGVIASLVPQFMDTHMYRFLGKVKGENKPYVELRVVDKVRLNKNGVEGTTFIVYQKRR